MKLKYQPEDFIVEEILELPPEKGDYAYFELTKKSWNTLDAVKAIAKKLHIRVKDIGYAGNKDKQAVTKQYISIYKGNQKMEHLEIKDITLLYLTQGEKRINLGDNRSNKFILIVRDLDKEQTFDTPKMLNLFDAQRFGEQNADIGKFLLTKNFQKVCELLELHVKNNDYVGAIRTIERRQLRFYIHAYQSYIWNETVLALKKEHTTVPLIGFLTSFEHKDVEAIVMKLLEQDGLTLKDFLMKPLPELATEGAERIMFVTVEDLHYSWQQDDIFKGKFQCTLTFTLPKGAYATHFVTTLFRETL